MTAAARACAAALAVLLCLGIAACGNDKKPVRMGLILKEDTNPFFKQIKSSADSEAGNENVKLTTVFGKSDVDNDTQVKALALMTAQGIKGILIVPADSKAIVPAIEKARRAGAIVVALDSPTDPQSATDALYATDNERAGELIGRYAKARAVEKQIKPQIAMLDLAPGITLGMQRHDGFLAGFGISDDDPRIVGTAYTEGDQVKARAGMARLIKAHPGINVVYTINEPSALGASAALKAAGKGNDDVILVSVDGSCDAMKNGVRTGAIDATAQQYPVNMATKGIDNVAAALRGGKKPSGYLDTGVELIAGHSVDGVSSRNVAFGVRNCWG